LLDVTLVGSVKQSEWQPCVCVPSCFHIGNTTLHLPCHPSHQDNCAPVVVITGPNAGGKSTLVRMSVLLVLLAQIGSFVSASSMYLRPYRLIATQMGATDQMLAGLSTFAVEMRQVASMLTEGTRVSPSLLVFDELGRSTATSEGAALAAGVVQHYVDAHAACREGVHPPHVVFITHFPTVVQTASTYSPTATVYTSPLLPSALASTAASVRGGMSRLASNWHMDYLLDTALSLHTMEHTHVQSPDASSVVFLYKLAPGPTGDSFGLRVAEGCGLPPSILEYANQYAHTR
jgi:DNA mismatch repair protein MSH3